MLVQKIIAGALFLGFSIAMFVMARDLPHLHGAGDVGPAFLPEVVAVCGAILSGIYLATALPRRDPQDQPVQWISVLLLAIFLIATAVTPLIGLPLALGFGSAAAVLLLERGGRWWLALLVGVVFWALTQFGFGWLLQVPLP